jgi:predicted RNA methylase
VTHDDPARRLLDPGYTPARRELAALLDLLAGEEDTARQVERCLARAGVAAALAALERLPEARPPARARLVRLVGRVAGSDTDPRLDAGLRAALHDEDARTRRYAVGAIGRARVAGAEPTLVELWADAPVELRRALAETLGKIGGEQALELLRSVDEPDPELTRRVRRALVMLQRTLGRDTDARVALDVRLPQRATCVLLARAGLAPIVAEQLAGVAAARIVGAEEVRVRWDGTLAELLVARCALAIALRVPLAPGYDLEERIVATLASSETAALLSAWTRGVVRFSLRWQEGDRRRASVWRIVHALAARTTALVNDPSGAPWEVLVRERDEDLLLIARRFDDPRFAYRRLDVRGSSHPTVAAALAHVAVAGAGSREVVWDPFVGGALELIERGLLAPCRELHGSDCDPAALEAARSNLETASLDAVLVRADARSYRPPAAVDLIVTNPPMGRRVVRSSGLGELLEAFLANAAGALRLGGRLVWLSPLPERTAVAARRVGMQVERLTDVNLGGFDAEMQIMHRQRTRPKPAGRRPRRPL